MAKRGKPIGLNDPLYHPDHRRPKTRREFISQGFMTGAGTVLGSSLAGMISNSAIALQGDLLTADQTYNCGISGGASSGIPFICFDLAGGANIAGSNVLVGQSDQLDFLNTDGYRKQGLRADEVPDPNNPGTNIDETLGLRFQSGSAMLQGILQVLSANGQANVDGIVIPARSQNDTQNNMHNPMFAIYAAGARGTQVDLIGSRNSMSGGNSVAPDNFMAFVGPDVRPSKVDNPNDVLGFQEVGKLAELFPQDADRNRVMEAIYKLSDAKLSAAGLDTGLSAAQDAEVKRKLRCAYLKAADLVENADTDLTQANPVTNTDIVNLFSAAGLDVNNDREFRKTASVMKMVIDGKAGAGTITMGGYDYHTGDRVVGEDRDLRAGRCIGAVLEYAHLRNTPVMLYVFSDGSVFSNGNEDPMNGRLVWTGDNQQTAASFILVYNPTVNGGRTTILRTPDRRQIGTMSGGGDVNIGSSVAANDVRALVQVVLYNYLALSGRQGDFESVLTHADPNMQMLNISSALGDPLNQAVIDQYALLGQIV